MSPLRSLIAGSCLLVAWASVRSASASRPEAEVNEGALATDQGLRLRLGWGLGLHGGRYEIQRNTFEASQWRTVTETPALFGPQANVELGVQFGRAWGVLGELQVGSLVFSNHLAPRVLVDVTLVRHLSFAAGFGLEAGVALTDESTEAWALPAVPARVRWLFLDGSEWRAPGRNAAWYLELAGAMSLRVDDSQVVRASFSVGYSYQ